MAEDKFGNVVPYSGSISAALASHPTGSKFSGQLTASQTNGVITLSGLTIDQAGSGYSLTVSAGTLTAVTTSTFTVSPGVATHLVVLTQPSNIIAGSAISLRLVAEDQFGNVVIYSGSVSVALASHPAGSTFGGQLTASENSSGVITLSGLTLSKVGSGYTLTITLSGVGSVTTLPFSVLA